MLKQIKYITLVFSLMITSVIVAQGSLENYRVVEVAGLHDSINYKFIETQQLYKEGWDTLVQPNFWRTLMTMGNDSALINIGSTRQIIRRVAVKDWNKLTNEGKDAIRDSVKKHYGLPDDEHVYMTSGKKEFYDFEKVIPSIGRGIEIFNQNKVDPFYAQVILLIESPNKTQKSPVGAYGSFQIMRKVAINLGLKVNKYVDERKDFDRSAWASAKLIRTICIPETNKILDGKGIVYNSKDLWYKLLVLHTYHAGAGNVKNAINQINPTEGNMSLITTLWQTEVGAFRNASQNYSQLALASLLELDEIIYNKCKFIYYCPLNEI
ncbi:MAG: transglycosylase SLT domain-containing protein [Flavobacteriales bacterium]|nr:transglycosylase SLT domain-containing protein [Flavobacteriales bacterium]